MSTIKMTTAKAQELTALAEELKAYRKAHKGAGIRFPLELRQRVGKAIKHGVMAKDAGAILGLHSTQITKWKQLKQPASSKVDKKPPKVVNLKERDGFTLNSAVPLAAVKYHISRFQAGELIDPDTNKYHIQSAIDALGVLSGNTA